MNSKYVILCEGQFGPIRDELWKVIDDKHCILDRDESLAPHDVVIYKLTLEEVA